MLNISTQKQFNNGIRTLPKNEIIHVFGYRVFSYASIAIAHSNGMAAHTTPHPGAKAVRAWNDQELLMLVELSRNLFGTERLSFQMLTEDDREPL